jgi:N-acetyl-1-D-myo-inositol-2-amino-2-deoxy-alpha-D-glucopyranoside deacetylase
MSGVEFHGQSLLAVFAHPDDESLAAGGLLACCAARGARVSLLCLSRGEAGPGAGDDLGATRTRELHAAAEVLQLTDVTVCGHRDGMLPWLSPGVLEGEIGDAIAKQRPDVVVTFGDDGLYWHPDHIATFEAVRAAIDGLGHDGPALFVVTMPPGQMRRVLDTATPRLPAGARKDLLGIDDPDAFGAEAAPPTLVLRLGPVAARKLAAIQCHRTQVEGGPFDYIRPAEAEALLDVEHYRRVAVGSQRPAFIERLAGAPLEISSWT